MNSQYYHHYNYCTLYIYILHRSFRTLATTQIHPWLSRASAMFTGQFHSTSMRMICRLPCDLRASYGNPLISRHLWTWSNGWFSTSSFYHWERDVLALCLLCPFWGDPGSPDMAISWRKKFGSTPDGSLKATAVFFACALQQTKGLGSTVDLDHLFIIYEILYAVICSIYGLSISAGLHIMSATCSTWFRWRYVN